jgi:acyl-coenzyme A thioesterase PaaI-like protein
MKFHEESARIISAFVGTGEPPSARRRLAWRLGDNMRDIIDRLVDTQATDEDLEVIASDLEAITGRLSRFAHGRRYVGASEASIAPGGDGPQGHADYSPVIGRANPLSPPLALRIEEDKVIGTVTFGHAYEGPPGHVHGGLVAAAFDELLGATQALSGSPGMTGSLTVDYRAPTPLHTKLRLEGTLDRVEGRKIFTTARLYNGEQLCAEASGLFISIDFAKMAAWLPGAAGS